MSNLQTTPYGIAVRPRLNLPDTKNVRAGMYHTRIRFAVDVAAPIIALIDAACEHSLFVARRSAKTEKEAARVKTAPPPYEFSEDRSSVEIKFRMKAVALSRSGTPRKQSPLIFAANGENNQKLEIGHGDTIRVSYSFNEYSTAAVGAGVSLDMVYVQVAKQATAWTRPASEFDSFE